MLLATQPKQLELMNVIERSNKYEMLGFGGARGGAKSHGIRDLAIYFGYKYNIQSLIFRRLRDDLMKNHVYPLLKLHPELRPYFNKTEMILYNRIGNPIIKFDYAEREEEIEKVGQGTEYPLVFIDEATQSTQGMIEYLTTCNRDSRELLPSIPKTILTMNPGGVGHAFCKRIFVDKQYLGNEEPGTYYFIHAHVWDNIMWCMPELKKQNITINEYYYDWTEEQRKDFTIKYSTYAKRLSRLPQDKMLAALYGDWEVFGGMFFKHFSKDQVIKPFRIPEGWELGASMDPGFASPLSFGLMAKDYKGNIYRIATYYNIDKIPNHARAIKDWLTKDDSPLYPYLKGRMPDWIVSGLDAFSKLQKNSIVSSEDTVEDYFNEVGLYLERANTARIPGWWKVKGLIPERLFIFEGLNEPLITQITSVESDKKVVEDIQGRGNNPDVEDHALDEIRYGIQRIYTPAEEEVSDLPEWYEKEMGVPGDKTTAMGV